MLVGAAAREQKEVSWVMEFLTIFFCLALFKGQIKPKANWRAVDSPKKRTNELGLFAILLFTANKINLFARSFFGRMYCTPILLLVLSDL